MEAACGGNWIKWLLAGCLFLLVIGYLLQAVSPLRINTDSYRLLSMAVSAHQGEGYLVDERPDQFPLAYPFLIKVLLQTGMASSMSLVILNLICLLVGLVVLYTWCKPRCDVTGSMLSIALVLSSWIMVKHVTLPLTELLYFAVSMLCLFFASLFWQRNGRRKWPFFFMAILLGYVGLNCRTVGLLLLPTLGGTVLFHKDIAPRIAQLLGFIRNHAFLACLLSSLAIPVSIGCLFLVMRSGWFSSQFTQKGSYFQNQLSAFERIGIVDFLLQNTRYRILEFGGVFSNIPGSKLPQLHWIRYVMGMTGWGLVIHGAWLLARARDLFVLPLYFLFYTALMLTWPHSDSRFWLPLLPLIALFSFRSVESLANRWRSIQIGTLLYVPVFVALGFVAVLFSTRISLSGTEFSELFGDGSTKMTYRYAFQNGKEVDMRLVSEGKVRLLQVFEPLAHSPALQQVGHSGSEKE